MLPTNAHMSTVVNNNNAATNCIDGRKTYGMSCHSNCNETAPWLALEFPDPVKVTRVDIYNRRGEHGARTKNLEVRLTNDLPTSGDQMYTGGELLGTFVGPGVGGEIIKVEGSALTGRYILIQMDSEDYLNLLEVEAFGSVITTTGQQKTKLLHVLKS